MLRIARTAVSAAVLGAFTMQPALALEPANLQFGPLYFTPTLDLEAYYTDNLWLTDTQEKNTWVGVITPRLQTWLQNGASDYSLTFELEDSTYASSDDDDFTDYTATVDVHQVFNARNRLNLYGEYYDGHEKRGTGFIEGELSLITDKPIEYERSTFGGDYTYGSKTSRGRLKVAAESVDFDYQNYRDFTRFFDRTEDALAGTLFWKVAPRTDALVEARAINNDYDDEDPSDPAGTHTSDELNYLLGVAWEATGRTSGHVKLGIYDRDYDSGAREDEDGFLWEVGVRYQPRTYSTLDLNTRRYYQETNGLGDGINTRALNLGWGHSWNQRSSTHLNLGYMNDDYEGGDREDDTYDLEARYDYGFRRWVDLSAGYRYQYRDSDLNFFDYSGNIFFLEARMGL